MPLRPLWVFSLISSHMQIFNWLNNYREELFYSYSPQWKYLRSWQEILGSTPGGIEAVGVIFMAGCWVPLNHSTRRALAIY